MLVHKWLGFATAFVMVLGVSAHAATTGDVVPSENDAALIGEVQVSYQAARNSSVQRSLFRQFAYLEKPINTEYSVFGSAYQDQEFKTLGIGVARKFGDFQVGLGIGKAYYDGENHTMPHGFVYYAHENDEGLLSVEKYLKESVDSTFVKGYYSRQFGSWIAGMYGETGMGVGLLVGYKLTKTVKLTFVVPAVAKPDHENGGVKFKMTLVVTF